MNAQTYRINAIVNNRTSEGFLNSTNYATIGKLVLEQCDGIDKVMDGFITNPALCKPDLSPLLCGAGNASSASVNSTTCLKQAQVDTMYAIWGNFTAQTDAGLPKGSFIFPGFEPGAEGSPAFSVSGVPYGPGPDYYEYQVLNKTDPKVTFSGDETELERLLKVALETDPGQTNAADPEIGDFLAHGKLLTYVGEADTLIPTHSSHDYYEDVRTALGHPKNLSDSYRFFTGKQANALHFPLDALRSDASETPQPSNSAGNGPLPWRTGSVQLRRTGPTSRRSRRRFASGRFRQAARHGPRDHRLGREGQPARHAHCCKVQERQQDSRHCVHSSFVPVSRLFAFRASRSTSVSLTSLLFRRYPQFAKYMGGDSNDASNFKCIYDW